MADWGRYYAAAGDDPRETLLDAASRFAEPGFAVDLGAGTGRDTRELLRRGWHVLAIDAEAAGLAAIEGAPGLEKLEARIEDALWPECDLVNASFSLPFVSPGRFDDVWARIVSSLPAGGRFAGQLFGERDEWAADGLAVVSRARAEELLAPFDLERFEEVDRPGRTATGEPKHWHVFHVVARRR